jgi:hypothetical protein
VRGEGLPWRLEPGQRRLVAVEVDLSAEPEFVGRLQIELVGRASGAAIFHAWLKLEVIETGAGRATHGFPEATKGLVQEDSHEDI